MGIFNYLHLQGEVKKKTGSFYRNVVTEENEKLLNDYQVKRIILKENFALVDLSENNGVDLFLYDTAVDSYYEKVGGMEYGLYLVVKDKESSILVFYKEKREKLRQLPTGVGRIEKLNHCWLFIETKKQENREILFTYEQGKKIQLLEGEEIQWRENDYNKVYIFLKKKDENGYVAYEVYNDRYILRALPYFLRQPQTLTRGVNRILISEKDNHEDSYILACSMSSGGFHVFGEYERIEFEGGVKDISYIAYIKGKIHIFPSVPYGDFTTDTIKTWNYQEIEGEDFQIIDQSQYVVVQIQNVDAEGSYYWEIYCMNGKDLEPITVFKEKVGIRDLPIITPEGILYPFISV